MSTEAKAPDTGPAERMPRTAAGRTAAPWTPIAALVSAAGILLAIAAAFGIGDAFSGGFHEVLNVFGIMTWAGIFFVGLILAYAGAAAFLRGTGGPPQ